MEWKNIHFVWKQFLSSYNLPNIIYSNTLKNLFKEKYLYDENSDSFIGITSKYLPVHSDFIKFWENTITVSNNNLFYSELEIDEICSLFKYWTKHNSEQLLTNGNICEDNILILKENESTYIPLGSIHQLSNPGKDILEIIEVQSGNYLGEDDIERFEDKYGRQ